MTTLSSLLSIRNLRVRFGGLTALDIESLELPSAPGVTILLMGSNGAGKTTLLNAMTGYATPERNSRIEFCGVRSLDLAAMARADIVKAGVARTFQTPTVFPSLRVREAVELAAFWSRPSSVLRRLAFCWRPADREAGRKIDLLLESLDLTGLGNAPLGPLPLSTLRRVEIARCLATSPRLLLLDEPTAGSDDRERSFLIEFLSKKLPPLMKALRPGTASVADWTSVYVVTHDLQLATGLSVQTNYGFPIVHLMEGGRVRLKGRLDQLMNDEGARRAYFSRN